MKSRRTGSFLMLWVTLLTGSALAFSDARLLRMPDIHGDRVVFVYAGDLWTVSAAGGTAVRLTAHPGMEALPAFSPDGRWIAFTAQYAGNWDVFVIPSGGGSPRRLTWHPLPDFVTGWTPDSQSVLFSSPRDSVNPRYDRLYRVPVEGGPAQAYPLPMAFKAALSPDGKTLAYTSMPNSVFSVWRRYRGGMAPFIWIWDVAGGSARKVPRQDSNDTDPRWFEGNVMFLSDRDRVMNLHLYESRTGEVKPLTRFTGADVKSYGTDGKRVVFEREGYLHLLDPATGAVSKLTVSLEPEAIQAMPRYVKAAKQIQNLSLSPAGKRVAFEARGEILTVPVEKGDIRNLTRTPGAMEREPAWSPDGTWVAYFGEEGGEYALKIVDQKGEKPPRVIPLTDPGWCFGIRWSPDSKRVAYKDSRLNLFWLDLEKGLPVKIDSTTYFNFYRDLNAAWSPDGKWIAYDRMLDNHFRAVMLYSVEKASGTQVTDGMSDAWSPAFDRSGKYLYFLAGTNRGQVTSWLDLTSLQHKPTATLYAAVLSADDPSPFGPQSDDEKEPAAPAKAETPKPAAEGGRTETGGSRVDLEGLRQRIVAFPVAAGFFYELRTGNDGKVFFLEGKGGEQDLEDAPQGEGYNLHRFDLGERKDETILSGISRYELSANGMKLVYGKGQQYFVTDAEGTPKPGEGKLRTEEMTVWSEPAAEWRQMAREAWRICREWFYDPGMHGQDWPAVWDRYEAYLPYLASRSDLNYVLAQMLGELCVGHAFVFGGDVPESEGAAGGLLGADYETVNGFTRIRKIYAGENWNPGLRSPLTEPGIRVKEGEYVLEVDGQALKGNDDISRLLLGKADRQVRLRVNGAPTLEGSRVVTVVPLASEANLRYRDWLENNRKTVERLSNGRVGYIYLPDTSTGGFTHFNRYFFPQVDKEGLVVDERFNGGGSIADYFVEWLDRPLTSWWMHRMGKPITSPLASVYGPKALIVNEYAGSGGDMFPYLFRQRKIGPLVGKRTWGGLVGITGYPVLMDGGGVTAPSIAFVTKEGTFAVENEGVAPDIEVEYTPADFAAGRDPQLEKAVESVLKALEAHKAPTFAPGPFPRGR
ncbi:MAG: PD40 domain-containing protein [Acidobacteria bacterium]|nr:PD40 domain-containing protein [Acidobacteriota bacterium]